MNLLIHCKGEKLAYPKREFYHQSGKQFINESNWTERSLCYLCRAFDNLNRGQNYKNVKPSIQIGLLDITLFEDSPELFANYHLANTKNHIIYSDKFRLSVLDLTQISLATEEDRAYQIDRWLLFSKPLRGRN